MVVVLDIEVIRALTGNYKAVIIKKDNIKCYGFYNYGTCEILDVNVPLKEEINSDIVLDFLRKDIIAWKSHPNNVDFDIVVRNDDKVLQIERTLLSSVNNEIKKNLITAVKRSLINLIKKGNGFLEINLVKDKITVLDKYCNNVVFMAGHLSDLEILDIVNFLLSNVSKFDNIKINYQFNKPIGVSITAFNSHVDFSGDKKNMQPIIENCTFYKENLKNINCHQLKMEGF